MASETDQAKLDGAKERPLPSERESAAHLGPDTPRADRRALTVQIWQPFQEGTSLAELPMATGVWVDLATVDVKPRTPRRMVIAEALKNAGISPDPAKPRPRVRVLDEESAAVVEPDPYQPPAEWRVS